MSLRRSTRACAARTLSVAQQSQSTAIMITHAAAASYQTENPAAVINHNNIAFFSRGIDIDNYKQQLVNLWTPRLAQVTPYVCPIKNGAGRPNKNDPACVVMEMVRVIVSDFSLADAGYVLKLMSQELNDNRWNVTYSTLRKRTEVNDTHHSYYPKNYDIKLPENRIKGVNWTTAHPQYASTHDGSATWEEHMQMLAEVIVAVRAVYAKRGIVFNPIEMACKALDILDTVDPALVAKVEKKEKKVTEKKQKGKKRSRSVVELETPVAPVVVAPPIHTRNLRSKRNHVVCTHVIDDHHLMDLDTISAENIAVPAMTPTAPATPAPALAPTAAAVVFVVDQMASMLALFDKEAEEKAQNVMDQELLQATDGDDILLYFPNETGLAFLELLKVFEIQEPAVAAAVAPTSSTSPQQEVKVFDPLIDISPEFQGFGWCDDYFNNLKVKLDAEGKSFVIC